MAFQVNLLSKTLVIGILILFIGVSVFPNISGNIKTIEKVIYEDVTNDRIEDMYGLKYYDRGYFINNHLVEKDANLVNTNNNGPGEIDPIWISSQSKREYYKSIEVYEDYIYTAGLSYDIENETHYAIIGKYDPNDGSQIWMKNWSTYYSDTEAWSIDVYNNAIYVVGYTFNRTGNFKFEMDSFICKFDLNGSLVWSKIINESTFDKVGAIKVYDDFVYVCGVRDFTSCLLKYDTNGTKLWSKFYEIPNTIFGDLYDLDIYEGYIYADGETMYGDPPYFNRDLLVVKFDLDGELQWYKKWGGNGVQYGTRMDIGDDGFIYIPGFGTNDYIHENDFICKFNLNGKIKWVATTSIESVLHDGVFWNGDVYVIGDDRTFDMEMVWDVLLAKIDDQGNLIWYLNYKRSEDLQPYAGGDAMVEYEDYFYLVGSDYGFGFIMKYDVNLYSDNNKPDIPSRPSGQVNGFPGVEYDYSTSTTDLDGDLISYCFSWGDNNVTLTEWMNSGETVSASHNWRENGKYNISVRARDEYGFVSEWSDLLVVTMNEPPSAPTIDGPPNGKVGMEYEYTFNAIDPDGDDVKYLIDWGDVSSDTTAFSPSGTDVKVNYTWNKQGDYTIKAKAVDTYDAESNWSEFKVNIPRTRATIYSLFQLLFDRFPLLEVFLRAMNLLR